MVRKFFILLLCAGCALPVAAQSPAGCAALPAGIKALALKGKPFAWQGDFNHDGLADRAELVSLAPGFTKPDAMRLADPWEKQPVRLAARGTALALLITQAAPTGPCSRFVLTGRFLESPLWQAYVAGDPDQDAVHLIKAGTPAHKEWRRQVRALRGDALTLSSEAGIDVLLYWKKDHHEIFWPDEEP